MPPEGAEPSEIAAAVHARVRRIAERVMWDHVTMDLTARLSADASDSSASPSYMLAALLSELGSEIADALPEQAARAANQLRSQLNLQGLQDSLTSHQQVSWSCSVPSCCKNALLDTTTFMDIHWL